MAPAPRFALTALTALAALLASCAGEPTTPPPSAETRPVSPVPLPSSDPLSLVRSVIPERVVNRDAWAQDVAAVFRALALAPTREHLCAVASVIEQESGFEVDTPIPGLGTIAWREIDRRAEHAGIPPGAVREVLRMRSADGRSYAERIDAARTEKQLSDIFEDFVGTVPLGRTLFASWNPIHTRGPMQVNVAFAERFEKVRPYPFPVKESIDDELFSRRGSLYFGIAHLLAYPAGYDRYLYRFADYNAGQYASRNAAFQHALARLAHVELRADGALEPPGGGGETERAALALAPRLELSDGEVRAALEQGHSSDFEQTRLYQSVMQAAARRAGRALPYAVVPSIRLEGPKLHRRLTTEWYAQRVNERYERCLQRS